MKMEHLPPWSGAIKHWKTAGGVMLVALLLLWYVATRGRSSSDTANNIEQPRPTVAQLGPAKSADDVAQSKMLSGQFAPSENPTAMNQPREKAPRNALTLCNGSFSPVLSQIAKDHFKFSEQEVMQLETELHNLMDEIIPTSASPRFHRVHDAKPSWNMAQQKREIIIYQIDPDLEAAAKLREKYATKFNQILGTRGPEAFALLEKWAASSPIFCALGTSPLVIEIAQPWFTKEQIHVNFIMQSVEDPEKQVGMGTQDWAGIPEPWDKLFREDSMPHRPLAPDGQQQ